MSVKHWCDLQHGQEHVSSCERYSDIISAAFHDHREYRLHAGNGFWIGGRKMHDQMQGMLNGWNILSVRKPRYTTEMSLRQILFEILS